MHFLIKILGGLFTLAALAAAAFAVLLLNDSRPLVPEERTPTAAERAWAAQWLRAASPRGLRDGELVTLTLSESEANTLGAYLVDRLGQGRFAIQLHDNRAQAAASLGLPWDPDGSFLNLELTIVGTPGLPRIEGARIAGVPLPGGLVQTLADRWMGTLDESGLLHQVDLEPGRMRLTYEWRRDALEKLSSGLIPAEERARLVHYQNALVQYSRDARREQSLQLADLLTHLLDTASGRGPGSDPVTENRALILALAAYTNGRSIRQLGDPATQEPAAARPEIFHRVLLRGRRELAQHFMSSAALASQTGNAFSDLVGLFKEASDSRGGSGFSFADFAANRAGTRFAERATQDAGSAVAVQDFARKGLTEDDFMPSIEDLPEGLSQDAFAVSIHDTNGAAYRSLVERIERRIDAGALFRFPEG